MDTFASLLEAGLPLHESLGLAAESCGDARLRSALEDVRQQVRGGQALSDAFDKHQKQFSHIVTSALRAAEESGRLVETLIELSRDLRATEASRRDAIAALLYPGLIAAVGFAATAWLVVIVMPQFAALLQDAGAVIPGPATLLLASTDWLRWLTPTLAVLAVVTAGLASWYGRSPEGRERLGRFFLHLPLLGRIVQMRSAARISRTVSTLLAAGVPLDRALNVAAEGGANAALLSDLRRARESIRRGESLGAALTQLDSFPPVLARLVRVGEQTGALGAVLHRAAVLLDGEAQRRTGRLLLLLEPTLVIVLGVLIGFVAMAMLQAIHGLNSAAF